MKRTICVVGLVIVTLSAMHAALADGVKLAYKFRAGEIEKYKLSMKMNLDVAGLPQTSGAPASMTMNMSMVMRQKTLGVYPDGSAKLYITCDEPKINVPGMPALAKQPFKSPPLTMVMGPDGSVRKIEGLEKAFAFTGAKGMDFGAMPLKGFVNFMGQGVVFPLEPVEIGQSWENSMPLPFGDSQIKLVSTLASANCAVGKTAAAKIEQAFDGRLDFGEILKSLAGVLPMDSRGQEIMSGMSGGMDMFGTMVHYFAPGIGKILKSRGEIAANLTITMPPEAVEMGGPPRIDMIVNMAYDLNRF